MTSVRDGVLENAFMYLVGWFWTKFDAYCQPQWIFDEILENHDFYHIETREGLG